MKFLLFQLYGPLQAWGSVTSGMVRKTDDHPTKSGVLGLVAACLGIESTQEKDLLELQSSLGFSCREDIPGKPLEDLQTIKTNSDLITYFENLRRDIQEPENLILSYRHYLVGALFTICLWETGEGSYKLQAIDQALSNPVFIPYMGRKCCQLALPFGQIIVTAANLREAYSQFTPDRSGSIAEENFVPIPRVFWEGSDTSVEAMIRHERWDVLKNRRVWAYGQRTEYEGAMERGPRCITKVA